jgi:hypothetical protein
MVILPALARPKSTVGSPFNTDFRLPAGTIGAIFRLKITASGGTTPTLDCKFQAYDDAAAEYFDILDTQTTREALSWPQQTGAATLTMLVYPYPLMGGTAEGATDTYRLIPIPSRLRFVATYGADADETFTFSLGAITLR